MPAIYLTYAPFIVISVAVLTIILAVSSAMGGVSGVWGVGIISVLTIAVSWLCLSFSKQLRHQGQQSRQLKNVVDRIQAVLSSSPDAYCIFTPQGLMRESSRMGDFLGVEKISHFEDIVAAIKEPEEFVALFRRLQMTGEGFSVVVTLLRDGRAINASGARLRVGPETLLMDIIWLSGAGASLANNVSGQLLKQDGADVKSIAAVYGKLPFPVWLRNVDLNLVGVNDAYAKALDVTKDVAVSKQQELASITARGGSGRALAAKALETGRPQTERRHVIIAGKRQLLELTETPYEIAAQDGGAAVKGVFGFAINVTAEEEKDTEIQRHAASQREVLEHMGSAITIYGADTRLEFYNRSYLRLWHTDEAFLDSKPTFGEVMEDARARRVIQEQADFPRYKKERIALFTSLLEPREDLMHLPDGTTLRILVSPHPMGGLIFVHEDVTDKLALESSYNTLIAVQRETLDNLAEGIIVFGSDGKVGLFNPVAAKMWQVPMEYLASHPHISDLLETTKHLQVYNGDWNEFKKEAVAYTLDRNPRRGRMNLADGTVLEYVAIPLPDGAVMNSYLDVTDSIKAERALRASNMALAAADRLKSEFVANVSYQLRTPLNTIMGFAEILANQYFGTLNERQMEYTMTIMDASKKLLLLINDVLDLATIEAGRMALDQENVRVSNLLNAAKQMTAEWVRQQSLEIVIDCPSDLGSFYVDEQRMKQVLFNLISNAVKYTPAGGRITLEARRSAGWVSLSVIDTGMGIPEDDLGRVFGKFERSNTHMRQSGAGLGLSLVKSFVELHGGRIEIESSQNQGTKVTCFLPVQQAIKAISNDGA